MSLLAGKPAAIRCLIAASADASGCVELLRLWSSGALGPGVAEAERVCELWATYVRKGERLTSDLSTLLPSLPARPGYSQSMSTRSRLCLRQSSTVFETKVVRLSSFATASERCLGHA